MSAEALATLYIEMDGDDAVRNAVAGGDFRGADLDLAEQDLIRSAAAEDLPEVIPFSSQLSMPSRHAAISYIGKNIAAPQAQAQWLSFFDQRQLAHIAPGL
jgi:hypothetical protein